MSGINAVLSESNALRKECVAPCKYRDEKSFGNATLRAIGSRTASRKSSSSLGVCHEPADSQTSGSRGLSHLTKGESQTHSNGMRKRETDAPLRLNKTKEKTVTETATVTLGRKEL